MLAKVFEWLTHAQQLFEMFGVHQRVASIRQLPRALKALWLMKEIHAVHGNSHRRAIAISRRIYAYIACLRFVDQDAQVWSAAPSTDQKDVNQQALLVLRYDTHSICQPKMTISWSNRGRLANQTTYLFWIGEDGLQFTEENFCAYFLIEVFDLHSNLFRLQSFDCLDENFYEQWWVYSHSQRRHKLTDAFLCLGVQNALQFSTLLLC